jgi:hypothetical protein
MESAATIEHTETTGFSATLLAFQAELSTGSLILHHRFRFGDLAGEVCEGSDSLWAILRSPKGGGLALRVAYVPGGFDKVSMKGSRTNQTINIVAHSVLGRHDVIVRYHPSELSRLVATTRLTPSSAVVLPFIPRDLYILDIHDDPAGASGQVEAAQRGLNTGLLYLRSDLPAFGSVLYVQNFSALNTYFQATGTRPDGVVGGDWPELGYQPPTIATAEALPGAALPADHPVTLSEVILVIREQIPPDEAESARYFVQMLGEAYKALDLPPVEYRDWVARARRTISHLARSPKATVRFGGRRYAHPYTDSEYPDSMVQLALLAPLDDYSRWSGRPLVLAEEFESGLARFWDPRLRTFRRYLPNVGDAKDADAVDSWYLYHPLMNLGRLALAGNTTARELFEKSIGFGIRAARHFKYLWPIQYKVTDFSIITAAAADGRGQTDVGGLYAWVMIQAYELMREEGFLREAEAAINAAKGARFNLNYQANLTAWGAAACMRLWRITNQEQYRLQSYVYIASFFHNSAIWNSRIGHASRYRNFLGVTCLQDAPYMAIYECFDSFAAFEQLLRDSGPELEPAARMLVSEYCRYALDRAWYYYPDALPAEALSDHQRNGHIDRSLSFPLEDLYVDGQPAGQVGQEIYGAGAALVFATRSFHNIRGAPFRLFCDHFIMAMERVSERSVSIRLGGGETCMAQLAMVKTGKLALPQFVVQAAGGDRIRARRRLKDRAEFHVPASGRVLISWADAPNDR